MIEWVYMLTGAMLVAFTILGILFGFVQGYKVMEKSRTELGILAIPLGGAIGGFLFYWGGLVLLAIISFAMTYWLPIVGVCAFVASAIYAATHPDQMKMLYETAKRLCEAIAAHIKLSDSAIIRYARKQTKRLVAIAPDLEWLEIRTSISELGNRHIPNLLRERKSLHNAIKRVNGVLRKVEWHKKDRQDFEKANARRSAQNIENLVVKLQKNEIDIAEALDTLRHLEADLVLATVDTYKRDEIKAALRGLVSRIQQNTAAIDQARTESDDYAHQRPRRLTE